MSYQIRHRVAIERVGVPLESDRRWRRRWQGRAGFRLNDLDNGMRVCTGRKMCGRPDLAMSQQAVPWPLPLLAVGQRRSPGWSIDSGTDGKHDPGHLGLPLTGV
jgi:hypothetical protein